MGQLPARTGVCAGTAHGNRPRSPLEGHAAPGRSARLQRLVIVVDEQADRARTGRRLPFLGTNRSRAVPGLPGTRLEAFKIQKT